LFPVNPDPPPVVINGEAGTVRADAPETVERVLDQIADRTILDRVPADHVDQRVREHLNGGVSRIAVGGGDGTLAAVADLIRRESPDTELVCLPLGTHNHFAKDLGVPLDPERWLDWLVSHNVRRVDLGEANGRLFLNNLSIGLYPALVKQRQNLEDERLLGSKRLATLAAAVSIWQALPPRFAVRIRVGDDGKRVETRLHTRLLMISNNPYADEPLTPLSRSTLSGGELMLYAPKSFRFLHVLPMAFQALYGDLKSSRHVHTAGGSSIELELEKTQSTMAMDGELVECGKRIEIRLLREALRVVVPEAGGD
jgi:diacylglycerol kinase family enzyme